MPQTWQGHYFDGRTAERHPVTIQPTRTGLHITNAQGHTILWPYHQIRQTQGSYEGEQVRLETGGELSEAVVVPDPTFLTAMHKVAGTLTSHVHDPSRRNARLKLTVLAAAGAIGVTAVLYLWGIPGLAGVLTPYVPVPWEQHLGKVVVGHLTERQTLCQDAAQSQALDNIVGRLTAAARPNPYTIHLYVVDSPFVNALAAPGGHIIIFRGLLEKTDSAEQLAGVLAHELQHIYKRHTTRAIIEHTSTGLLLAAVSGDFSGAMTYGIEASRALGMLEYSRSHEKEADTEGMRLLEEARIDPAGMIEFFEFLRSKSTEPAATAMLKILSSHPATADRIAYLEQLRGSFSAPTEKLLPDLDWKDVRNLCTSKGSASHNALATPPTGNE